MASDREEKRIGIWGRSGSGKSAYFKQQIRARSRVIVFDPTGEYAKEPGFTGITHTHADDLETKVKPALAKRWRDFKIAYKPPEDHEPEALSALSSLIERCQINMANFGRGLPVILGVEEMNLSFKIHKGQHECPGFAALCSRGRHSAIEIYGLSQRMAEVDTRFRGNCTDVVAFSQFENNDIRATANSLGVKDAEVRSLQKFEFFRRTEDGLTREKLVFSRSKKK